MYRAAVVLCLLPAALLLPHAAGQDKKDPKKEAFDKRVQAQKKAATDYWKEIFETDKVPIGETPRFIMVGGKPGTDLVGVGYVLEQEYALACKLLQRDKEPTPWPGKLTVFLVPEAKQYPHSVRVLLRRKAEDDEVRASDMDPGFPFVVACAGRLPGDLGALANAAIEMTGVVLNYRARATPPLWLVEGFGRAVVIHSAAASSLAAERRKASASLTKTARNLGDVFGEGTLKPEEQPYLRFTVIDYLAFSGRTTKWQPFIDGLLYRRTGRGGSLELALKSAGTSQDELTKNWEKYVKAFK
jgi:hypothetical protein